MNIYAQKFKRICYSFNKVDLLTKGVQTGIKATGNKSSDTIHLNIVDQNIRYGKKKPFVCRKNQSVFLITSGMYVYELVE